MALQKVVETPAKRKFCKKLLRNVKKNYKAHWKSCIQDGDFPQLSKAIVKTIKRRANQRKAAKRALKKAVRRNQKMAGACGLVVKIPTLNFGAIDVARFDEGVEIKGDRHTVATNFHLLKAAAHSSALKAQHHQQKAKVAKKHLKKKHLTRSHLFKAASHTAHKIANKHSKNHLRRFGKGLRRNRPRTGHKNRRNGRKARKGGKARKARKANRRSRLEVSAESEVDAEAD